MARRPRLLIVNPSPVRGGAEELLQNIVTRLDRFDVLVACTADGSFPDDLERAGVRVRRLRAGRLRNARAWWRTVRALEAIAREADLVLSWQVKGHYYGTPAARLAKVPCAWWDHGIRPAHGEPRHLIDARLPGALHADLVITSSRAAAARHPDAVAIHPGIPMERFASASRSDARAALGLADGEPAVAVVGRLQPWKGQDVFVRAAARVSSPASFLVIGGTPGGFSAGYDAELKALAASEGVAGKVVFLGHRDDVPALMPGLDLFVMASRDEPFGIVTVEAMASGVPVIATDGGGSPEIVTHGTTGWLVPAGDPAALARAIDEVLGDRGRAATIAAAAREHAMASFSIERCVGDVTGYLEDLARRASG